MRKLLLAIALALAALVVPSAHADATTAGTQFSRVLAGCQFDFNYWTEAHGYPIASARIHALPTGNDLCAITYLEVDFDHGTYVNWFGPPWQSDTLWHNAIDEDASDTVTGMHVEYMWQEGETSTCRATVSLVAYDDSAPSGHITAIDYENCPEG